jgi:hypothetical protein
VTGPLSTAAIIEGAERDLVLRHIIRRERLGPGRTVVAVVDRNRIAGIAEHWDTADACEASNFDRIFKSSLLAQATSVNAVEAGSFPAGLLALGLLGTSLLGASVLTRRGRRAWVGLGCALASAPPLYAVAQCVEFGRYVVRLPDKRTGHETAYTSTWALPVSLAAAGTVGLLGARYRPFARVVGVAATCVSVTAGVAGWYHLQRVKTEARRLLRATALQDARTGEWSWASHAQEE